MSCWRIQNLEQGKPVPGLAMENAWQVLGSGCFLEPAGVQLSWLEKDDLKSSARSTSSSIDTAFPNDQGVTAAVNLKHNNPVSAWLGCAGEHLAISG